MKTYSAILQYWNQRKEELKIYELLETQFPKFLEEVSIEGICSAMMLLLSFGEEAICEILQKKDGQIILSSKIPPTALIHWVVELLSIVTHKNSLWHALYQQNCFTSLTHQLWKECENTSCAQLSLKQKSIIIQEMHKFKQLPAGTFLMGAIPTDSTAWNQEKPQFLAHCTVAFWICSYLVSQICYESLMGHNPSHFIGATRPVESVSWCDAIVYCNRLSLQEGLEPVYLLPNDFVCATEHTLRYDEVLNTLSQQVIWKQEANGYRLPTEIEWEYAARAGEATVYAGSNTHERVSWNAQNSAFQTRSIAQKEKNPFDLYDMSGNVDEWVWDSAFLNTTGTLIEDSAYPLTANQRNPSQYRMFRGGSWILMPGYSRISSRNRDVASIRLSSLGFRIVRNSN